MITKKISEFANSIIRHFLLPNKQDTEFANGMLAIYINARQQAAESRVVVEWKAARSAVE